MPTYSLRNKVTGEVQDKFFTSMSKKDTFLEENPDIEVVITSTPGLCDSVRIGIHKKDSGFKEVLQKIHEKTPGSDLKKNNVF